MAEPFHVDILPLIPERWDDFEALFGPRGACAGCWCLFWKLARKEFTKNQGEGNRLAQKQYVLSGGVPGLIAYHENQPCGWIAVEPRGNYPVLNASRILKALDGEPVWSITCFYIKHNFRRHGITIALIINAIQHVHSHGGSIVEGYPNDVGDDKKKPPVFIYTGVSNAFIKSGFTEVARRSEKRPIMRFRIY